MQRSFVFCCLISAICAYGQQGLSPYATLSEPPTLLQPGGNSSNGDTWFHAWGSLPKALSDSEAAQATNALEDYLYCGARNISFHGAPTGNH